MVKHYYQIGEVARMLELEPYTLRYWEGQFPKLHPRKNSGGKRIYTPDDIETLKIIKYLLYEKNFTIEGARQEMSSNDNMQQLSDDHTIRKPLEQSKNRIIKKLEELQDSLDLSPNAEDKLQKKQTIIDKINNICDLLMEHKIEKQDHNDPAL